MHDIHAARDISVLQKSIICTATREE